MSHRLRHTGTPPANVLHGSRQAPRGRSWHPPALLGMLVALWLAAAPAWAQLMVHPTRIVLGPDERAGQVEVINGSNEQATYRISLVNRRMGEDGDFIEIQTPGPGEQFADPMLRYSPRRVTVAPGASQVVRIMARRPADLAPGEYRSHLLFTRLPNAPDTGAEGADSEAGIGVALDVLVSVSIPVIVREGETSAEVTLADLGLSAATGASPPVLSLDMLRNGNQSVYGDLVVTFTPAGQAPIEVGRAAGVAVYTPNPLRRVRLALAPPSGVPLRDGMITVRYLERQEDGGGVLAESSLTLP